MGLVGQIAQSYRDIGNAQAQGAANTGAIWGGTLANLGQQLAAVPEQQTRQKLQQQELDIRQGQVDQAKRQQLAQGIIAQGLQRSIKPDGSIDLTDFAQAARESPDVASVYPELIDRMNKTAESALKISQTRRQIQQEEADQIGDIVAAARTVKDPADQAAVFTKLLSHAAATGAVDPEHAASHVADILGPDGQPDPQAVQAKFSQLEQLSSAGRKQREELAKPMTVPDTSRVVIPGTNQTLVSGAPKPVANETEAALRAVGAKDPSNPTPEEAAAALKLVRPQDPVVTVRTMENGKPVEKVLPRSEAVGKTFASQPPASVIYPKPEVGTTKEITLKPGTQQYRVAQDVAYGTLTMADFNRIYGRAMGNAATKQAIYDTARQLNPDFNPAQFELGFKIAGNPAIRQRLVAIDSLNPVIDKIEALSKEADLTNIPALNKFLSAGKFALGNRTITNYRQLQTLLGDEVGNALGVGTGSDLKTRLGLDLVNPNLGPTQFLDTMEQLRSVLGARKGALLKQMGPYAGAASGGPSSFAPATGPRILSIVPVQ